MEWFSIATISFYDLRNVVGVTQFTCVGRPRACVRPSGRTAAQQQQQQYLAYSNNEKNGIIQLQKW